MKMSMYFFKTAIKFLHFNISRVIFGLNRFWNHSQIIAFCYKIHILRKIPTSLETSLHENRQWWVIEMTCSTQVTTVISVGKYDTNIILLSKALWGWLHSTFFVWTHTHAHTHTHTHECCKFAVTPLLFYAKSLRLDRMQRDICKSGLSDSAGCTAEVNASLLRKMLMSCREFPKLFIPMLASFWKTREIKRSWRSVNCLPEVSPSYSSCSSIIL